MQWTPSPPHGRKPQVGGGVEPSFGAAHLEDFVPGHVFLGRDVRFLVASAPPLHSCWCACCPRTRPPGARRGGERLRGRQPLADSLPVRKHRSGSTDRGAPVRQPLPDSFLRSLINCGEPVPSETAAGKVYNLYPDAPVSQLLHSRSICEHLCPLRKRASTQEESALKNMRPCQAEGFL